MDDSTPRRRHWEQYRIEPKKYFKFMDELLTSTYNLSTKETMKALKKLQKIQQALELNLYESANIVPAVGSLAVNTPEE